MKRALLLIMALVITPSLFSADWIPPGIQEDTTVYCSGDSPYFSTFTCVQTPVELGDIVKAYLGESYDCSTANIQYTCSFQSYDYSSSRFNLFYERLNSQGEVVGQSSTSFDYQERVLDYPVCEFPEFPIPVDTDGNGEIDRCYQHQCGANDQLFSNPNLPSGNSTLCIQMPDGSQCEYNSIDSSGVNFQPSSEACDCQDLGPILCAPFEEGLPNNPNDDQPDCVQLGDQIFCAADETEECDASGQCNPGCGTVNGVFICHQGDSGDGSEPECELNDPRPQCSGVPDGDCPFGVLTCEDPQDDNGDDFCGPNDQRLECQGDEEGDPADLKVDMEETNAILREIERNTRRVTEQINNIPDEESVKAATEEANTKLEGEINKLKSETSEEGALLSEIDKKADVQQWATSIIPSSGGCSPMSASTPHGTISIDLCESASYNRVYFEYLLWLLLVAHAVHAVAYRLTPT